jgi:uncharacterized protein YjbI with pentapeptide repeats
MRGDILYYRDAPTFAAAVTALIKDGGNLSCVDFKHKDLFGVNFSGINLSNCDFSYANLMYANFADTECAGALFNFATCSYTNFYKATLGYVGATCATFSHASFRKASLRACNFYYCDFRCVDFTGACVDDVGTYGANLTEALNYSYKTENSPHDRVPSTY